VVEAARSPEPIAPDTVAPAPSVKPPSAPAQSAGGTAAEFSGTLADVASRWSDVVDRIGAANRSMQALLRDARPIGYAAPALTLGCKYPFHRDRLNEDRARAAIEGTLRQIFSGTWVVRCVVDDGSSAEAPGAPTDQLAAVLDDPVVKGAITLGWRVRKVTNREEVVYDAEPKDDTAAPGTPGQDTRGAG
jgi:hypothetical protein